MNVKLGVSHWERNTCSGCLKIRHRERYLALAGERQQGEWWRLLRDVVSSPNVIKKVKWYRYRPGVAQRMSRGIALLIHDRSTRRGWVVSSTPWPHFTTGKDPVPIVKEAGWAPGPVRTVGRSRPYRDSIPDRPARSQSLLLQSTVLISR